MARKSAEIIIIQHNITQDGSISMVMELKDINKATYWYDKAAALGNKEAEKMLKVCKLHSGKN